MKTWTSTTAALMFGILAQASHAQSGQTAQKEVLLQTDHAWTGKPYDRYPQGKPQLTVLKVTVAPHAALPWHTHPVPNALYVLSGTLTIHDRATGKSITVHAGQAAAETVDEVHRGVNDGAEPLVLVITYAGTAGVPTSVPVAGEQPEY